MIGRSHHPAPWAWWLANAAAILGLIFFVLYYSTSFRFGTLFTLEDRQVDFRQWYHFPPLIVQHLQYPSVATDDWNLPFPYLPSAVAMFLPLSALSQTVAFGLWLVLQAFSFVILLWAGLKLSGAARLRGRLLLALAAVLLSDNQLGWDFRAHNNNIIYLALIMLGLTTRATWLSGLLFAISANLKIYSGFLIAAFIWRREYRLAAAAVLALILVGVFLPIAVFGFTGYTQLLAGWLGQVFYNPPPGRPAVLPPDLMRRSAAALLGAEPASTEAIVLMRASQALWAVLVLGYFIMVPRPSPSVPDDQARLSDSCVALLAPLPFSVYFAPYHAIVLLPAYFLLLTAIASNERPQWIRAAAAVAVIGCQIAQYSFPQWEFRGATSFVSFILIVLALGAMRLDLRSNAVPAPAFDNRDARG